MLRRLNVMLNAGGVIVFALLVGVLVRLPDRFDRFVGDFLIRDVAARVEAVWPRDGRINETDLKGGLFDGLSETLSIQSEGWRLWDDIDLEPFVRIVVEELGTDPVRANSAVQSWLDRRRAEAREEMDDVEARLREIVRGEYEERLKLLRQDVLTFALTSLGLTALGLIAALRSTTPGGALLVVSSILSITTAIAVTQYLFGQDWVFVLLMKDFWGIGYTVFAVVLAVFLIDVAFNRSRITRIVGDGIQAAISNPPGT